MAVLELVPSAAVQATSSGVVHWVCCDDSVAYCGMDVTDDPWAPDSEPVTCLLCRLADGMGTATCAICNGKAHG